MSKALVKLFERYIRAFEAFDLTLTRQCYALPCALHTPDKIVYLMNEDEFNREFTQIFSVLQQAGIKRVISTRASFNELATERFDVCIDWAFIDKNNQVFTDFCAFYQIESEDENLKIINVVSHDIDNGIALTSELDITVEH